MQVFFPDFRDASQTVSASWLEQSALVLHSTGKTNILRASLYKLSPSAFVPGLHSFSAEQNLLFSHSTLQASRLWQVFSSSEIVSMQTGLVGEDSQSELEEQFTKHNVVASFGFLKMGNDGEKISREPFLLNEQIFS